MSIDARFVMNRARFVPHAIHKRARRDRPFRIVPPFLFLLPLRRTIGAFVLWLVLLRPTW